MPVTARLLLLSLGLLGAMFITVACQKDGAGVVSLEFADSSYFFDEPIDTSEVPDTVRLEIFDSLWQKIDDTYTYIEGLRTAWESANAEFRPQVITSLNNQEYRRLLLDMMAVLEDENLTMVDTLGNVIQSYVLEHDVNWRIGAWETTVDRLDYVSKGGWGWGVDDSIGYFFFKGFDPVEFDIAQFDTALGEMQDKRAILFDIRSAGETAISLTEETIDLSGTAMLCDHVLGRFVNQQTSFLGKFSLANPVGDTISIEPNPDLTFDGDLFILMGEGTFNEAELFAMALDQLPNVHLLGDPTPGVVGVTASYELSPGWNYTVPVIGFTTLAGDILQGESLPPDHRIDWEPASFNNRDQVLLDAFALIDEILE